MNSNLKRTIIHEIGHFVAIELNNKLFETGECLGIELIEKFANGVVDYEGLTKSNVNNDEDEKTNMELLSQRIAVLVYGCYFQCLFEGKKLNDCFGVNDTMLHGSTDREKYNITFPFEVGKEQRIETEKYLNKYLKSLEEFKEEFDKIFNQDFNNILTREENKFEINLKLLKDKLGDFLNLHIDKFKEFQENINLIKSKK